jgi:predicted PurR-regulated permease PerM
MPKIDSPARAIARNVLVVAGVVLVLYVIYLLRQPISWLIIAAFLAVALAGPVNFFQRYMKRGLAITLVYVGVLLIPIGLGAVLVPPIVNQVSDVATNAPRYVHDVEDYVQRTRPSTTSTTSTTSPRSSPTRRTSCRARPATPPESCATSASGSSAQSSLG